MEDGTREYRPTPYYLQSLQKKNQDAQFILDDGKTLVYVYKRELMMKMQDQDVTFSIIDAMKCPANFEECFAISISDDRLNGD